MLGAIHAVMTGTLSVSRFARSGARSGRQVTSITLGCLVGDGVMARPSLGVKPAPYS